MINFDHLSLTAFLEENKDFFINSRIQKIQQPTRQELVFSMRNCGKTKKLYVNISPNFFHICFTSKENEEKRFIEIPSKPPMFCMLLRKHLENAKTSKINQPQEERILELYFETYNELGEKIYLCLAIELMGKHSNVCLYNYDTNVIIGCAHNVGAEKSSVREMMGGLPYAYPPKAVKKSFSGLYDLIKNDSCINDSIDNYFADIQEKEKIKNLKSKLYSFANAKLKKAKITLQKIQKQISTEKADQYRKKADLIMANLYSGKDFSKKIEVFDYEINASIKIELDEEKTLKENANKFYKLYNKSKVANEKSLEIVSQLLSEIEYLEQIIFSIEEVETLKDLVEIQEEVEIFKQPNYSEKKNSRTKSAKNIIEENILTFEHKGFTVYVGKNNKQNDYIVSKLARSEDIWFHVHNCAGSHVLLRVKAGQIVSDEIIFFCAKLAKEHSTAKMTSKIGVIYTKAKNLKKPPAAKLGYVIYKGEEEIIV